MEKKPKEIKSEENNLNNNKKNKILDSCSNLTPLKFVKNIELIYNSSSDEQDKNDFRILSNFRKTQERKFDLIDFEIKTQNTKILKKIKEITCIKIVIENIFIGLKNGYVYMYQIETGLEKESFGVESVQVPVNVIHTKEDTHLIVGYNNGCINIFDIKNKTLIKNISNIHKTGIMALEYILIEKTKIQLLTSDEEGQVINIISNNGFLSKKTVGNLLYKDTEPVHAITKFKPFQDKKLVLFGFASTNQVSLYNLKLTPILEIKRPKYTDKDDVPDIDIGWAVAPIKEDKYSRKENVLTNKILFIIGWGRVITIYSIMVKGDIAIADEPVGYYKNNLPIIRIGFFSPSIIYFFDDNKQLKVIDTAFCNTGPYDENKEMNKNALIDEGKVVDKYIKYDTIKKSNGKKLNSYRNYITCLNKYIYLFTDNGLKIGKILDYVEYIDSIIKSGNNWKAAMCLAIDIYKGYILNFPGVPLNNEERKKSLKIFLVELLSKYLDYNFNVEEEENSSTKLIKELNEEKITECINISIEFCMEINSIDYLLKNIEPTFSKYGREDLFYKLLEPFIFSDLFYNEDIGIEALTSLYGTYKIKNELILLSHLLIHINIKCLNNFMIKKLSMQENLFDLIIYIFSNGNCAEDYFLPITKMFECFNKLETNKGIYKEENEHKYISYYDLYVADGINGTNKMEQTKEYIGHKLMWYINMCLSGNKLGPSIAVDSSIFDNKSNEYIKLIAYIYFWILHEDVFLTLLKFDSYSLFILLEQFFTEAYIINLIKNFDFSTINADSLNELIKQQENGSYLILNMNKITEEEKEEKKEAEEKEEKEDEENEEKEDEEKEKENKEETKEKDDKNSINEINTNFDPFALKGQSTNFGSGVKLNNINSVLEYIINLVESQSSIISNLDLYRFLIKYVSNGNETIDEKIHTKILEAFIYCLKYCLEYSYKRKDLITQNEDKFNNHFLSKKSIDTQNPFFIHISNLLNDLIDSKKIEFKEEELFKIKLASGKLFNSINIKIAELSKNYKDCLDLLLEEENNKSKEKVFDWIENKFKFFNRDSNNKNNNSENTKNKENFIKAIIELIPELIKLNNDRTKKIISKFFKNDEKLEAYKKLKYMPSEQFEILEIILLYEKFEQIKEEEENIPKENGEEQVNNIDLFELYKGNMNINNINLNQEKIVREQFDNLLLEQIKLLVKLNRKDEVIKYLKIDIPYYPTFPLREALNICIENSLFEAAIYIYQVLNENQESFDLTMQILDKSFEKFKQNPEKEESDFLDKLNLSIKICKENSESLLKKDPKDKMKKDNDSEGEELWFDLLKKLYEYEDSVDKIENNKKIKESLQIGKATLLKEISSYVRIQKLISYVTEKQEKAEYKEYKTILETMLRWNNSFDRVLYSVMTILKTSIENAESTRKKVISKGNNYNIKKCDVCNQFFQNTKDEIVYFFGCGHQSHEKCCYKKKINNNKNRIILHKKEENEESFLPRCEVCRKNKIENRNKMENDFEEFIMSEDREDTDIVISKENIKMKAFKFGNKKDKLKKLDKYDMKYQNEVSIFNN